MHTATVSVAWQYLHPLPLQDTQPEGTSNTSPHSRTAPLPIPERMGGILRTRAWCANPRKSSLAPKFQRVPHTTKPTNKSPCTASARIRTTATRTLTLNHSVPS